MATCLLSQATVLATMVQNVRYEPSGAQQMVVSEAEPSARRSRLRSRRQHTTAAVGTRTSRRNRRRTRQQGTSGRRGNQGRHN